MGQGYFSKLKISRKQFKLLVKKRLGKVCIRCGDPLKNFKRVCDYCSLRKRVTHLEKDQRRLFKLVFDLMEQE